MKKAYDILRRAKKVTDSKKNDITIASLAEMSGINDATLRRLLKPGVKHKTLDMIARLEKTLNKIAPESSGTTTKSNPASGSADNNRGGD